VSNDQKKIRVMHVIAGNQMGGTERMLCYLVPNYEKEKFETCLVTCASPSKYTEEWQRAGIEQLYFLHTRKPVSLAAFIRIFKHIKQWKPDVIFAFGLRVNISARIAAWLCRVPVFITGQRGIEDWKGKGAVLLEKITSIFVDVYIGNSKACCDMLARREKISASKLQVIYNGIQLNIPKDYKQRAADIRARHYPDNAVVIGSIGRLNRVKGHEYLIKAVPKILKQIPEAFFVIVGHDQYKQYIHKLVKKMGLDHKVILPGYSADVASWLESFDVFALPSISEGMPVSVLEAFLMKCPVVATQTGGTPELVKNHETGLLVPARDSAALATAIVELVLKQELGYEMSERAFVLASKSYSLEQMMCRYCKTIEALYLKTKR